MTRRVLLQGGRIVDGTGAPGRHGDVVLEGDRIAEVGGASLAADEVVDARGMVVAPGFIDIHSHGDFTLPMDPEARAKVLQGVTTEVVGNCGLGLQPGNDVVNAMYQRIAPLIFGEAGAIASDTLAAYRARLEGPGLSVNAACLIPHGNVRCAVMGMAERAPTAAEIARMRDLVEQGMSEGAFGLSTGLIYPPGAYADTDEVVRLAEVLRPYGGVYATHMRNEGSRLVEAVAEAIEVGQRAGVAVQLSHHKAAGRLNWGKVKRTLAMVDAAAARGLDVHSDVYPYTAGSTVLSAIFVPLWAFEGSMDRLVERLRDPPTRARIIHDAKEAILAYVDLPPGLRWFPKRLLLPLLIQQLGTAVIISSVKRQHHYEGRAIGAIARERGVSLHEAMTDLLVEEDVAVAAIAHVMCEDDVRTVLAHPRTMVGTDGFPMRDGKPHPRTFGTYPRVLEHYVREVGLLSLEDAVHRMTGMVARKLGLRDRGVLRAGAMADVVVFDPRGVHDRATFESPANPPDGIAHVFVGGAWTVRDGAHTGARAGRVLARGA